MISTLLVGVLPLILLGAATIVAAFTLDGDSTFQGWFVATVGALGLIFAMLGHTTHLLDLATVFGVVVFGGIAGSGWSPRRRRALLVLGFVSLVAGLLPHFGAVLTGSAIGAGVEVEGSSISWAIARSAGFVAFLSATGAVLLGARRPARLPVTGLPARIYALHRALGITAVLAVVTHLVALRLDTFVQFSWLQLLAMPWSASYRPFALTLGFLAAIFLIVTAMSGGLRRLLPGWRLVHLASYLTFGLNISHGLLAGSDSSSPLALFVYIGALFAVGVAFLRRFSSHTSKQREPKIRSQDATLKKRSSTSKTNLGVFSLHRQSGNQGWLFAAARSNSSVGTRADRIRR